MLETHIGTKLMMEKSTMAPITTPITSPLGRAWSDMGGGAWDSRAGDPRKEERVGVRGEKLAGRSPNNDGTRSLG